MTRTHESVICLKKKKNILNTYILLLVLSEIDFKKKTSINTLKWFATRVFTRALLATMCAMITVKTIFFPFVI